jgi:methyl-accepting chemotaxis protein
VLLGMGMLLSRAIAKVIRALLTETRKLEEAVQAGRLDVRGDLQAVSSEFQPIVAGVNKTMDAFARPIRVTSESLNRLASNEIPPQIVEEYRGDFDAIKRSLNGCIGAVALLDRDADKLARGMAEGRLSTRIDAGQHGGAFRKVAEAVNGALQSFVSFRQQCVK